MCSPVVYASLTPIAFHGSCTFVLEVSSVSHGTAVQSVSQVKTVLLRSSRRSGEIVAMVVEVVVSLQVCC